MTTSFLLAKTINDENEFSIKFTKLYLTVQEALLVALVVVISYPVAALLIGSAGLLATASMFVSGWIATVVIDRLRKNKPASYLWDLRYRFGVIPEQRCWMRCSRRRPRILLGYHQCAPHVFLGGTGRHDLLSVDQEWRRAMPPGGGCDRPLIAWPALCLERPHLVIDHASRIVETAAPDTDEPAALRAWSVHIHPLTEGGYPAPIWFYAPLGFGSMANHIGHEKVLYITLPLQRSHVQGSRAG